MGADLLPRLSWSTRQYGQLRNRDRIPQHWPRFSPRLAKGLEMGLIRMGTQCAKMLNL
jgi:hypothetical protein